MTAQELLYLGEVADHLRNRKQELNRLLPKCHPKGTARLKLTCSLTKAGFQLAALEKAICQLKPRRKAGMDAAY